MYYRRFLSLIEYVILARRRILFVNDKHYLTAAVADVALTVGEAYALGY